MGAIAGVFRRDRQPVDIALVDRLSKDLLRLAPDREVRHYHECVAIVHRAFYTSAFSQQFSNVRSNSSGVCLVWDGRLDNRSEVAAKLRLGKVGAAELGLTLYENYGARGFAVLVGDFSFALWDPTIKSLFLCTDSMGRNPVYYHVSQDTCLWSTSGRSLAGIVNKSLCPNPDYVADFLVNRLSRSAPLLGATYLSAGHYLRVTPDTHSVVRYWAPDTSKELHYVNDVDYEQHFLSIFDRAVADRLDANGPVFVELSGGVDSSTIASTACRLARSTGKPDVKTVSYVFDSAASSDERQYIRIVEEFIGKSGLHLSDCDCRILMPPDPSLIQPEEPTCQLLFLSRQDHLAAVMANANSNVILSGMGGDQMFLSENVPSALPIADLIVQMRFQQLIRSIRDWSSVMQWPFLRTLWQAGALPLMPSWALPTFAPARVSEFVEPDFVKTMNMTARVTTGTNRPRGVLPSRQQQYSNVLFSMRPFALNRCLSKGCVDVRYPYLDRRLFQYALALPLDQKARIGETRSVVRRAFRNRLPEAIRQRRTKSGPTEALHRAFVNEWPRWSSWLSRSRVASSGYINPSVFQASLNRARHGVVTDLTQLGRILALEIWLRTLDRMPADSLRSASVVLP